MIVNRYAPKQWTHNRLLPLDTFAIVNRKKSVNNNESTYPFRSFAAARPPPVKFNGRRTRKENTDILTMHRNANRWKRRKINESNPTLLIICIYVCMLVHVMCFVANDEQVL